ncbi:bifunctional 3,4-dihydroxy-2-butanone 4-phosphate synthase/GTP cyclohydrolase II-like protein [Alcanivorax sp. S71-1-4]|uniref:bifunctional 3,4-dihydroxy-2-butanone-4-phosphate synthase/GTP cyclohydrolase II n=1 Tax=Alcanivorax sp. S71-1-4 TaxID=1177159 RepID=UPI00135B6C8A|nr:bifunctional 3,4-dihydroxy-2-butanone-4-phosphate synthase/GTP cyclohydrolase II [Alcanivorax sp. S71-1-4]KAF0810743.1 bifunctional 3,4-dihydroxy-2-butanone 4-phosphate synthase/GTP cyclohydrolase II-like protein [Alcanivorax sp. S71-1-4]
MKLNTVQELIDDIRAGRMVILMDDEDRENEGDLLMAAEHCTPEAINFMIKYARGLVCMPMSRERCEQLNLPLMVQRNGSGFGTKFTVSIEAAEGVTTGISAADRARTVQAAAAPDAKPADIVQPGHIFPLMAEPGGVLHRAGHTEAACDLPALAGCAPMGVICEIINEDGTMARRPDLEKFAEEHNIKIGTIADLIEYRMLHEKTVERVSDNVLPTWYGDFRLVTFRDTVDDMTHVALVKGELSPEVVTTVRVHLVDPLRDLMSAKIDGRTGWNMHRVLEEVSQHEAGVVIILGQDYVSNDVQTMVNEYFSGQRRTPRTGGPAYRNIGTGSQILRDLGVRRMRLLSSPMRFNALSGFDLEIVEYVEPPAQ